jgi:flagellin
MAVNSVNTNVGALVALQNLNATNRELSTTQSRINTGLKVSTAKDNGAVWAIAQNQRAESQSLNSVQQSLQRGQGAAEVALAAGQAISDLLVQMKEKMLAATEAGITTASVEALSEEYKALYEQIDTISENATFDGVNLISGTDSKSIQALANADASTTIDVNHEDLSTTGSAIASIMPDFTTAPVGADVQTISTAIEKVSAALSRLGTGAKSLDTHLIFVAKLQDTLDTGVGNLVDADLAQESARLQALQVQQQLGAQALSIANSAPQIMQSLFRT